MYGVHILDQVDGAAPQVVRRLRGTRWARPRGLFYEVDANTANALAQDARGRLHAAIVGTADSGRRTCIAYARSRQHRWFTRAVSLTRRSEADGARPRVRLAVDRGRGVVAWATPAPRFARPVAHGRRRVTRRPPANRRGCPPFPR